LSLQYEDQLLSSRTRKAPTWVDGVAVGKRNRAVSQSVTSNSSRPSPLNPIRCSRSEEDNLPVDSRRDLASSSSALLVHSRSDSRVRLNGEQGGPETHKSLPKAPEPRHTGNILILDDDPAFAEQAQSPSISITVSVSNTSDDDDDDDGSSSRSPAVPTKSLSSLQRAKRPPASKQKRQTSTLSKIVQNKASSNVTRDNILAKQPVPLFETSVVSPTTTKESQQSETPLATTVDAPSQSDFANDGAFLQTASHGVRSICTTIRSSIEQRMQSLYVLFVECNRP
jgi:hypothetical protein